MSPFAIAAIALSMSADAFAAALGRGAATRPTFPTAIKSGLVFGLIEAITPLMGWAVGTAASGFVEAVDHWIAFGLLAIVGGHMLYEAFQPRAVADDAPGNGRILSWALIATAIGTSIDAAAVGVSLALIGANILIIAAAIGFTTFVMTSIGMTIGRKVGARFGSLVEIVGGLVLISIGTLILLEHLGYIG